MKAALITGAARRIGRAIAMRLAADGWDVLLHYATSVAAAEDTKRAIEASGGRASLLQADLSTEHGSKGLIDAALAQTPDIALLVNNASTFAYDTATAATLSSLQHNFTVNTAAPILLASRLAAKLSPSAGALVVNILDNRIFAPNPDYFSYAVSKHALDGATRLLALALAPRIRVNAIAPGITLPSGNQSEQSFEASHRRNPLGRGCTPEQIAAAVAFLWEAGSMTGAVITIDGGQSLLNPGRDVAFL
jgi:NAD(P)-dependent dehydrogenase (short-subunit alcohol dehydrogenase family)